MKHIALAAFLVFSSCKQEPIELSMSEVSFAEAPMNSLSREQLQKLSKDPVVRFQWKKALVKRLLEEKIEKEHVDVERKISDSFMAQAESELTQPNGIEVSGMVFFIPKQELEKLSESQQKDLLKRNEILANQIRYKLLLDPSEKRLRELAQRAKKDLSKGVELNLKVETKILSRYEVQTPGWIFIPQILDSHKHSPIDNVAPPVTVGTSIFLTILRKRINSPTLPVDVIRERADALGLASKRKVAVTNFFAVAVTDVKLELFPGVIQKDGTVE